MEHENLPKRLKTKTRPGKPGNGGVVLRYGFAVLLVLVCALPSSGRARSQTDASPWELSIGGTAFYVSKVNDWNFGPQVSLHYALSSGQGVYFLISYPGVRMTSSGYGFGDGLAGDAGFWFSPGRMRPWLRFGLGLSSIFGSDSDGSQIRFAGVHVGARASHWFSRTIGIWIQGLFRVWIFGDQDSRISPGFSAGLGIRL